MLDDFTNAEARWRYVADGVMGGVSQGQVRYGDGFVQLTGEVSTDNNGGFIQVRRDLPGGLPPQTQTLRLSVRGNGETYFVFLRTQGLARVWYSYRHSFVAGPDWTNVTLPLADFTASHADMPANFSPDSSSALASSHMAAIIRPMSAFARLRSSDSGLAPSGPTLGKIQTQLTPNQNELAVVQAFMADQPRKMRLNTHSLSEPIHGLTDRRGVKDGFVPHRKALKIVDQGIPRCRA